MPGFLGVQELLPLMLALLLLFGAKRVPELDRIVVGDAPTHVGVVPVEMQHVASMTVRPPPESFEAERREQNLVLAYKAFLESSGRLVGRLRIVPEGEATAIQSDLFEEARDNLVEAKGAGTRNSIRLAVGQLYDYGRFAPEAARAVLLPERPRPDLEALLSSSGVSAIWPHSEGFADNAAGRFV